MKLSKLWIFIALLALPKPPQDGWIVVGVVFTSDDILTGIAFAEVER